MVDFTNLKQSPAHRQKKSRHAPTMQKEKNNINTTYAFHIVTLRYIWAINMRTKVHTINSPSRQPHCIGPHVSVLSISSEPFNHTRSHTLGIHKAEAVKHTYMYTSRTIYFESPCTYIHTYEFAKMMFVFQGTCHSVVFKPTRLVRIMFINSSKKLMRHFISR